MVCGAWLMVDSGYQVAGGGRWKVGGWQWMVVKIMISVNVMV
jgi:hypothetical protein